VRGTKPLNGSIFVSELVAIFSHVLFGRHGSSRLPVEFMFCLMRMFFKSALHTLKLFFQSRDFVLKCVVVDI